MNTSKLTILFYRTNCETTINEVHIMWNCFVLKKNCF